MKETYLQLANSIRLVRLILFTVTALTTIATLLYSSNASKETWNTYVLVFMGAYILCLGLAFRASKMGLRAFKNLENQVERAEKQCS